MSLKINYLGMELKTPFIIAPGPWIGDAHNIPKMLNDIKDHWGGVVTKTYMTGANSWFNLLAPHLWTTKELRGLGMQNAGPGLSDTTAEDMKALEECCRLAHDEGLVIIGSIIGSSDEEWGELAKMMQDAGCDAVELDLSCPAKAEQIAERIHEDGQVDGLLYAQSPVLAEKVTRLCKEAVSVPVIPKLTGQIASVLPVIKACKQAGAAGFAAINTIGGILGVDVETGIPMARNIDNQGAISGMSGPMIRPIGLRIVSEICTSDDYLPVMGIGGVDGWKSAVEYIMVGATAVQICTEFMIKGTKLGRIMCRGLSKFMKRKGYESIDDFRGIALQHLDTTFADLKKKKVVAVVDEEKCNGCALCIDACVTTTVVGAISTSGGEPAVVDEDICIGCGLCLVVCKREAVSYKEVK